MKFVRAIIGSSFLRQNAIVFIGSIAVGVINYAYYPIVGRLLEPGSFGEVQALVNLFIQLILFLTVLGQVTVNIVANYSDEDKKQRVILELEKLAFLLSIILTACLAVLSTKLKSFFQFDSSWPFLLLLVSLVVSVPGAFRSAYLRAHKKFVDNAISQLIGSVAKVLFSTLLVLLGLKTSGAIGGLIIAQLLMFGYAATRARKLGFYYPDNRHPFLPNIRILLPELRYALLVLTVSLTTAILSSIDIFVVKHYFDPHTAGEYAAISTVAKIIFFLTSSVSQVLLPSVKLMAPKRENRLFLIKSLALVIFASGFAVIFFTVFSKRIVQILMGSKYLAQASLLPQLSLAMLILSIVTVIASYYLALRKYQIAGIVSLGTVAVGWLMLLRHNSLNAIATNLVWGSVATLGLFTIWRLGSFLRTRSL